MTILVTDLKYYKSKNVTTGEDNGGPISNVEAISGEPNNIWTPVLKSDRDNGLITYVKVFLKVVTNSDEKLIGTDFWNEAPTEAMDWITMFKGTADDTKATLDESDSFCACYLTTTAAATTSTLEFQLEDDSLASCFPASRVIRITDKSNPESSTGTEERFSIVGTPVLSAGKLTVTLDGSLSSEYAIGSKVEGVMAHGDLVSSAGIPTVTSSAGSYDASTYPLVGNNAGAVTETITMTMTDGNSFGAVGSVSGVLPSGSFSTDYSPLHPVSGNVMFTMLAAGKAGTFLAGDTLVTEVIGAYAPFWLKRVVPAGSASLADNLNTTYGYGQS